MGKKEKLLEKLYSHPKDFTLSEVESLLQCFDYHRDNKGRTSGSRIRFTSNSHSPILMHKPHPGNELRDYQIKQLIDHLKQEGLL